MNDRGTTERPHQISDPLVLRGDWWMRWRDDVPVSYALVKAHHEHWLGAIDDVLDENKAKRQAPSTWREIADTVHRDWANFWRRKSGKCPELSPQEYLAMASAAGLSIHDLFPENAIWLARATESLCNGTVSSAEVMIFVRYCLARPALSDRTVDRNAVAEVVRQARGVNAQQVETYVLRVARALGQRLQHLLAGDSLREDGRRR